MSKFETLKKLLLLRTDELEEQFGLPPAQDDNERTYELLRQVDDLSADEAARFKRQLSPRDRALLEHWSPTFAFAKYQLGREIDGAVEAATEALKSLFQKADN